MNRVGPIGAMATGLALVMWALVGCAPGTPPVNPPPGEVDADVNAPDAAPAPDAGDILGPPWNLIWQDEFEGPLGKRVDPGKWSYDIGGDGWGNEQLEFDSDRPENSQLDGEGNLAIIARREEFGGRHYTSARIKTRGKFDRQYGRFEARIKLPSGQGIWPAFWLLGGNLDNVGWPDCGEIDIMEARGQLARMVRGSLHGPGYSGGGNHGREYDTGMDLSQDFHTYAVEWGDGRIMWKVDDKVYFTATPADLPEGKVWVYDHPFFMILNVAVGGNFVGSPTGNTPFPQTMLVDYVRVYERIQQ